MSQQRTHQVLQYDIKSVYPRAIDRIRVVTPPRRPNWSWYDTCQICKAEAGNPCFDHRKSEQVPLLSRPHRRRKLLIGWAKYGPCPRCGAARGKPCFNLAFGKKCDAKYPITKRPHDGRLSRKPPKAKEL